MQYWTPAVRSSQHGIALANPFQYYLQHRLCLRPTESTFIDGFIKREEGASDPLLLGSVFHWCLEHLHEPNWAARAEDLATADSKKQDVRKAITMARAALQVPACGHNMPLIEWLNRDNITVLAKEYPLQWTDFVTGVPCYGIIDRLVLDKRTGLVWIIDYKTTSLIPHQRATSCSYEFQTWHYLHGLYQELNTFQEKYRIGGFQHIIVQKPGIKMGRDDRPYGTYQHTLKSGPRKGQVEIRREYLSDVPDPDLYFERVFNWYTGQGEYADRAITNSDPQLAPILVATTRMEDLNRTPWQSEYQAIMKTIVDLRSRPPAAKHYPRVASRFTESVWTPFYTQPENQWPEYMARAGLVQAPRHGDI